MRVSSLPFPAIIRGAVKLVRRVRAWQLRKAPNYLTNVTWIPGARYLPRGSECPLSLLFLSMRQAYNLAKDWSRILL